MSGITTKKSMGDTLYVMVGQVRSGNVLKQTSFRHNSSVAPDCSQNYCKNTQYQMNVKSETSRDLRKAYQPENEHKRYVIG